MAEGDRFNETLGHMVKFKGEEKKTLHLCTIEQPLLTDGETVAVFFNSLSFLAHIHFII